ncbi:MAG: phospholipase D-like domain-containing protein, partial [Desulfuromonadales bacterium]
MKNTFFFHPHRNCWRLEEAEQIRFLIDGAAYFETLADVLEKAEKAVYIIGWDIDSRIRLRREDGEKSTETLRETLNRLAGSRKNLNIYLLDWDFAMLYALEREPLPLLKLGWQTHHRVHFRMDSRHPVGASHHQKLVVVDDRIAFVGGLDLARCRWDTPEHDPEDPRRCDNGVPYAPFHDVQMMVQGPVAGTLGGLARRRWQLATGTELPPPQSGSSNIWPQNCPAELEQVQVAIMRTEPEYEGKDAIQEVKEFYLEAIASARHSIYIENQYLTAHAIGAALEERLKEEDGPDVVIVLPQYCSGWLEQNTMGQLRTRILNRLRRADREDRLGVYYPTRPDLGEAMINVHSKILVVDDILVRIGSSNL